jgi:AraC-like DNA-binding protein
MTITLSQPDYLELVRETKQTESSFSPLAQDGGNSDFTWNYPSQLGQGFVRELLLREGLHLQIEDYQPHDDIVTFSFDREHPLEYTFNLAEGSHTSADAIPYNLYGSGIAPGDHCKLYAKQRIQEINVHIAPEIFQSFAGQPTENLPSALQHLVGNPDREYYLRPGRATPAMRVVLQQIWQCPYQGVTKRMFLESKVMELMALILEDEIEAQQDKQTAFQLKSDDVERVHYAKEILHANFDNPPSTAQLARQVGLNECTLKRGFRACFNITIFGYLRQYRMEQAKVLLMQGRMNVHEAAQAVGYASQSRFAAMFRKTFGINPKTFSTQHRQ